MIILRILVLLLGITFFSISWVFSGGYLIIVALYTPLWKGTPTNFLNVDRPLFWKRALARIIDYFIIIILLTIFDYTLEKFYHGNITFISLIHLLAFIIYFSLMLFFLKQTIGDKLFRIKLESTNKGEKIRFTQILLRLFFLPLGGIQGIIYFFSNKKYLLHDRISSTDMVVKSNK